MLNYHYKLLFFFNPRKKKICLARMKLSQKRNKEEKKLISCSIVGCSQVANRNRMTLIYFSKFPLQCDRRHAIHSVEFSQPSHPKKEKFSSEVEGCARKFNFTLICCLIFIAHETLFKR